MQNTHCRLLIRFCRYASGWVVLLFSVSISAGDLNARWIAAIANDDVGTLQTLYPQGVNMRASDATNRTALMVAAKYGRTGLFRALLERGADPHARTVRGGTVLMFAVLGNNSAIVQLLKARDVEVDAKADNGWSALTTAAAKGYADILQTLIAISKELNSTDIYGWTPLMRAVDNGHRDAVTLLLSNDKIDLDTQNEVGETALHRAAINDDREIAKLLIGRGADLNRRDRAGRTPHQLWIDNGPGDMSDEIWLRH